MQNLTKDTLTKWQEAQKVVWSYQSKIEERTIFIIKRICQEFKVGLDYIEDFRSDFIGANHVSYDLRIKNNYNDMTILLNGQLMDLVGSFPLHWLFEDFEPELIAGKKAFEDKIAEEKRIAKAKRAESKVKQAKLKRSAAAKLTDEERKALGL